MRKVSFCINISLDGYCDHTAFYPSEELMDYFTRMMDDVDLIFYGRVMYELMFPYWADVARDQSGTAAENRYADRLCEIDRVVMSGSLTDAGDKTTLVRGNPAEELLKLKKQPGKTISVDSISLLPELIAADLIDEFYLIVHPAIVGKGRHLMNAGSLQQKLDLKLNNTIIFENGCLALHYVKP